MIGVLIMMLIVKLLLQNLILMIIILVLLLHFKLPLLDDLFNIVLNLSCQKISQF